MILIGDRRSLALGIETAHSGGARLRLACEVAGIDERTLQRWKAHAGLVKGDGRPQAMRPTPSHALSQDERLKLLGVANEPRFEAVPPARIVPMLADEGVYLASESTFSRVLRANHQTTHRGRAKAPNAKRPPTTHIATSVRQVWCWDMTYLPAIVMGRWFYLYLILDLYSRKIVGWEVHETRAWGAGFVHWYNVEHRHSGIQYVSPTQRHEGEDHNILAARHALYIKAQEKNPARWSGKTRNWTPIGAVTLNPERDCVIKAYSGNNDIQQLAA